MRTAAALSVIDANVWVSWLVSADVNHRVSAGWLEAYARSGAPIVLPASALAEIAGTVARVTGDAVAGMKALEDVLENRRIEIVDITRDFAERAARTAARLRLRGMDAIYATLAIERAMDLVTWDEDILTRAAGAVRVSRPWPSDGLLG